MTANAPMLNRAENVAPANTLYIGKEYENEITDNIYAGDDQLFASSMTSFDISDNEAAAFTDFLLTIGVSRFPRQKSRIIKLVQNDYKELLAKELPYPAHFGEGVFYSSDEFLKANLFQITITVLEHYEVIMQKANTEHILQWLMVDNGSRETILARTENNSANNGYITWANKQNGRRIPNTHLSSYMRFEFSRTAWLRIGDTRYSPCQCLFKNGIGDKLLPFVVEPDLDIYVTNAHQTITEKNRIQSLLLGIGASEGYSDLSTEALYGILLKLPDIDLDGNISRALYRSLIDGKGLSYFERNNTKFMEFQEKGLVFCKSGKGFIPCANANYLTERMVSREVQKIFNLIDIPSRKSKEAIRDYLCVPALEIKGKIYGTPTIHPLNDAFQKDFNHFKDFAFCYRIDVAKLPEVSLMKSLIVRLCSEVSADYGNGISVLDNCSFIRGTDAVYLKIQSSLDSIPAIHNDIGISEAVAEIITSLADIQDGEIFTKLCRLFSQSHENRHAIILREFDSLEILTRSKAALDSAVDFTGMLKIVSKGIVGELPKEITEIISSIDLSDYHSLSNAPVFINLLDALSIDVQNFNEHSEEIIHIDLRPYFISKLDKISTEKRMEYKEVLFAQLKNETVISQKGFIDRLEKYLGHIYVADNSKTFDVEKEFLEQWNLLEESKGQTNHADNAWQRNREIFEDGKDVAIVADLLSDKAFDSLLYFGAFDELEEIYSVRVKDITSKTGSENNILGSTANLIAPIEEINVTAPSNVLAKTKRNGMGSRTAGMVAERDNSSWGAKAEEIVYRSFISIYKNVKWVSENAKKKAINPEGIGGLGYDMTYIDDNGQLVYVEIKSTAGDSISFMITSNEIEVGEREGEKYIIALVTNVENDNARRIYEIKNLFVYDEDESRFSNRRFQLSADSYAVRCIKQ